MGLKMKKLGGMVMGVIIMTMNVGCGGVVSAANAGNFRSGYIISDFQMTDYNSMNEGEIQIFLSARNSCPNRDYGYYLQLSRKAGYTWHFSNGHFICLSEERFGDGEVIGVGESAAHIIWQAAQDYRINPKVLIVLIQKETGLITDTIPNDKDYRKATGYGCPDTAACSSQYYGFKNQVRRAAELFRVVMDGGWTNYPVGNNYIKYNPNAACGGSVVNVQNRATSALYRYTPYQPNVGALAAGYGTAPCGAYGNRNFYLYYEDWFGNIMGEAGYVPFLNPRYMILSRTVERVNPYTGAVVDVLPAGMIRRFTSKICVNGRWYYRTELMTNANSNAVIPAEAIVEAPQYVEFMNPRYLKLKNTVNRVNPYTGDVVDVLPAGMVRKYTSKIKVNGKDYYRTEAMTNAKQDAAILAEALMEMPTYEKITRPRNMELIKDVKRINPYTGDKVDDLPKGMVRKYDSRIKIDGKWYYRTEWATNTNADAAIPAEALKVMEEK